MSLEALVRLDQRLVQIAQFEREITLMAGGQQHVDRNRRIDAIRSDDDTLAVRLAGQLVWSRPGFGKVVAAEAAIARVASELGL